MKDFSDLSNIPLSQKHSRFSESDSGASFSTTKVDAITETDLLIACRLVSEIIDTYGEVYWPILDRLESELEKLQSRKRRLHKYLKRN